MADLAVLPRHALTDKKWKQILVIPLRKKTPDHSSLTRIRDRLPLNIHEQVFQQMLSIIEEHKLLRLKAVGVDSTLLEANAAMKTIARKDSGEDWKAYLKRLMQEQGLIEEGDDPSDEDLRKFDKARHKQGKKKVSNEEWHSPTDPASRIVKMKDGRTHLGYKAEHVVDLDNEIILSATVHHGTDSDAGTLLESVVNAHRSTSTKSYRTFRFDICSASTENMTVVSVFYSYSWMRWAVMSSIHSFRR